MATHERPSTARLQRAMGALDARRRAPDGRSNPRAASRVYTPEEVIEAIRDVEGMKDPDLHEAVRMFPRWKLVRWDPRRFYDRTADDEIVDEYVEDGPETAPPTLAIPGYDGLYDLMDGAHRRRAAERAGTKLRAFVAMDSGPGWVHEMYSRRREP